MRRIRTLYGLPFPPGKGAFVNPGAQEVTAFTANLRAFTLDLHYLSSFSAIILQGLHTLLTLTPQMPGTSICLDATSHIETAKTNR
jgi:hypothetical protein